MGYKNGSGVLEAKRILTTEALLPSGREANVFTVREIEGSEISVNKNGDSDVYIVTTTNADIYIEDDEGVVEELRVTELNVEDKILVVGVEEEGEIAARTIRVVSAAPADEGEELSE
jgi:hypothetical protein